MNLEEYEVMYKAESRHWWYGGMTAITRALLDRTFGLPSSPAHPRRGMRHGRGPAVPVGATARLSGFDFSPEALGSAGGANCAAWRRLR